MPRVGRPDNEHEIQKKLFSWIELHEGKIPELKNAFAIPNGGKRSKATAGKMKAEGQKAGVPDICLAVMAPRAQGVSGRPEHGNWLPASPDYGSLYIEMKTPKGYPSPIQREWADRLDKAGMKVIRRCTSWQDAARHMLEYLGHEVTRRNYPELFVD